MKVSTDIVAEYVRDNVNWHSFFSLIAAVGDTLNGQKDRFDKSDLIEKALETFSGGAIKYVNANGVDHTLTNLDNVTQEMKFLRSMFYGIRVTQRRTRLHERRESVEKLDKPLTIKLFNSMGENRKTELPSSYASYLLVVDNHSAGIIDVAELKPYIKAAGDGISAVNVPYQLFKMVVEPSDYTINNAGFLDYKVIKNKYQEEYLRQFI